MLNQFRQAFESSIAQVWERQPVCLRDQHFVAPLQESALFRVIQQLHRTGHLQQLKLFVDGEVIDKNDAAAYRALEPSEHNFRAYCLGVSTRLGGSTFGAQLVPAERFCLSYRAQAAPIAAYLCEKLGVPAGGMQGWVNFGNYRVTPFGIHRDPCSVFTWPVVGTKRFLLWGPDYFEGNRHLEPEVEGHQHLADSIEPYEADALAIEANPGDLVYWPSERWHVATHEPEVHASINLTLRLRSNLVGMAMGALYQELLSKLCHDGTHWGYWTPSDSLPEEMEQLRTALRQIVEDDSLGTLFREHWQKMVEQDGFNL